MITAGHSKIKILGKNFLPGQKKEPREKNIFVC